MYYNEKINQIKKVKGIKNEIWKDIYGYESLYQISNLGRVKSLFGWNGHEYVKREKILKLNETADGYLKVSLFDNTKRKQWYVHRLILSVFYPVINMDELQVNHIDENKDNNNIENLEWVTSEQNVNHGTRNERASLSMSKKISCITTG